MRQIAADLIEVVLREFESCGEGYFGGIDDQERAVSTRVEIGGGRSVKQLAVEEIGIGVTARIVTGPKTYPPGRTLKNSSADGRGDITDEKPFGKVFEQTIAVQHVVRCRHGAARNCRNDIHPVEQTRSMTIALDGISGELLEYPVGYGGGMHCAA